MKKYLQLDSLLHYKKPLMRAYTIAKNRIPSKQKGGDDYVEKDEFRYFLLAFKHYLHCLILFEMIDKNSNQYVEFSEFQKVIPDFLRLGLKIDNPRKVFDEMDTSKSGMLDFGEFAEWMTLTLLDLEELSESEKNLGTV